MAEAAEVVDITERVRPDRRRLAAMGILGLVLVGAIALAVHWFLVIRFRERTDDAFVEASLVMLSTRVTGTVLEVPVEENMRVKEGDVLVRLDPTDFEVAVARARANVEEARNRLAAARADAEAAEADRRAAVVELERAKRDASRLQELRQRGATSDQLLENAVATRDAAEAKVRALEQRVIAERAELGNEAPLRQAEAALREAELSLSYATLTAPNDGIVGRKNVNVGENVSPGRPLLALARDEASWVEANFKETQIGRMHVGDAAEVYLDAFPGRPCRGHVESLSPATGAKYALIPPDNATGNFTKVVQRLPVRVALDECAGDGDGKALADGALDARRLPMGLSAVVSVRVGSR
jgi:membrane fusion protein (multidrug efflux system)